MRRSTLYLRTVCVRRVDAYKWETLESGPEVMLARRMRFHYLKLQNDSMFTQICGTDEEIGSLSTASLVDNNNRERERERVCGHLSEYFEAR